MNNKRIFSSETIIGLIVVVILLAGSCNTAQRVPSITARAYHESNESEMRSDSLQGFVSLPGNNVLVRTTFSRDTVTAEIHTKDTLSFISMLINGTSVWFDPSGKKNQQYGVSFPAARSELLRKQKEFMRENENDSLPPRLMTTNFRDWVDMVQSRDAAMTDKKGTRFVGDNLASVNMSSAGELVYRVKFAFSQLDTSYVDQNVISVGVISEIHQAVLLNSQGGGVATRPDISDRDRRRPSQQSNQRRPSQLSQIPINGWVLFLLNEKNINESPSGKSKDDDVYFRQDK